VPLLQAHFIFGSGDINVLGIFFGDINYVVFIYVIFHAPTITPSILKHVNEQNRLLWNELVLSIPDDIPEPFSVSCAKLLFRRMCDPTDPLLLK